MSDTHPSNTYPDDSSLTLQQWLQERHDNARRIAWDKSDGPCHKIIESDKDRKTAVILAFLKWAGIEHGDIS